MGDSSIERIKYYVVDDTGWFMQKDGHSVKHMCQIDDAYSTYSYHDAVRMCLKCIEAGIKCDVVKYSVVYTPLLNFNGNDVKSIQEERN